MIGNKQIINEMNELPKIVAATDVGKKVNVKVWRNQRELTKVIIFRRYFPPKKQTDLGCTFLVLPYC